MTRLKQSRGRSPVFLFIIVLVTLVLAACGAGSAQLSTVGNPVPGGGKGNGEKPADQPGLVGQDGSGDRSLDGDNGSQLYAVERPDLLIIKTGSLSLQVTGIDSVLATASTKITALGGYVAGSSRQGEGDDQVATVTYRIPAAQWDAALVALRDLAEKVLAEQTQTQDVTGDVVDLTARIANLRTTEAALQAIMVKATKIQDVLAVQAQLTEVRGEIERLEGQKQHLLEQAAFSTLTVALSLKPQAAVVTSTKQFDPNSEIDRASASLVEFLQGLATAGIWFAIAWLPILAVLFVIGLVTFVIARRIARNRGGSGPIVPTPTPTPNPTEG
jgi:hypothetical protein